MEQIKDARELVLDAERDGDLAIDLLEAMFTEYENGTPCYQSPDGGGFIGYAFRLDDHKFRAIAELLERKRPRAALREGK